MCLCFSIYPPPTIYVFPYPSQGKDRVLVYLFSPSMCLPISLRVKAGYLSHYSPIYVSPYLTQGKDWMPVYLFPPSMCLPI